MSELDAEKIASSPQKIENQKITSNEFAQKFKERIDRGDGYVWGEDGNQVYTKILAEKYRKNGRSVPSGRDKNTYWTQDCAKWFGRVCADCSGGIVGTLRELQVIAANRDYGSASLLSICTKRGKVSEGVPDVDGVLLYRKGHVGIYYQGGKVGEFKSTAEGSKFGVFKVSAFTDWGYLPFFNYIVSTNNPSPSKATFARCNGNRVNVRSQPTIESLSLGLLKKDDLMLIVEEQKDTNWMQIITILSGKVVRGFISAKYIDVRI